MSTTLFLVSVIIITALFFDFTNGFHDSANAMATSVATGALAPKVAVLVAAILNVLGAFMSTEVAKTISGGLVNDTLVTPTMVFAGLVGAILWNLFTWLFGLPSSSSHALFGGLIGAVLIGAGTAGVNFSVIVSKILLPAVAAPLIAALAAGLATFLLYKLVSRADGESSSRWFRYAQTVSASLVALAHGTSDGQKTMGVITLVLITSGMQESGTGPQFWVIAAAGIAIGLGTYSGGWRIMRTMGKGIVDVKAPQGFAAETTSAAAILASSHMGFALSTTQVCSGSIMGSGLGKKLAEVRWSTARRIFYGWLLTLPAAAAVGAVAAWVANQGTAGLIVVFVALLAGAGAIFAISRRSPVDSQNVNDSADVTINAVEKVPAGTGSQA
ncbi:inorganic phosphate transporter [Nakamurella flava]|uniref:Phosphate transporter n=1 Tax=Nakamurella flava TaxID=2576308 RepID=A0A4U6QJP4_9ACTN|nr:inorganic phosphate transporter [Nakamurella flava]TKV60700.1 inorganic phosphate transporter [Nakamurella flava]